MGQLQIMTSISFTLYNSELIRVNIVLKKTQVVANLFRIIKYYSSVIGRENEDIAALVNVH